METDSIFTATVILTFDIQNHYQMSLNPIPEFLKVLLNVNVFGHFVKKASLLITYNNRYGREINITTKVEVKTICTLYSHFHEQNVWPKTHSENSVYSSCP